MAKQAEAERERRSNIINAGERAAAETLADAARRIIASTPGALNLHVHLTPLNESARNQARKQPCFSRSSLLTQYVILVQGLNKK